ncbi:type II secretion system minor pseudopilin GspH [Psychromonas sp. PT13]|uniref:type II secretion system minor pseudopilin GspH n=1 Tax=Psychromonas sp. PT13 TaxID=3439547 RepID=UPI003EB9B586
MDKYQIIQRKQQQGFTLLELMLVFLLMAMISVGVMMTLPNASNSQDGLQWQAQRFSTLVQFAEDEALISGSQLGLVFSENSYQFVFYDYETKNWQQIENKQIQNKVELPETLSLEYSLSGIAWDELDTEDQDTFISDDDLVHIDGEDRTVDLKPQVYLMSSGEVTPFAVTLSLNESSANVQAITITVSTTGNVTISEEE